MLKTAALSDCLLYRYTLMRQWDERAPLLAVMFNPSTADAQVDDPTISLLSHIASHNGYGRLTVVNLIPYRSSTPALAVESVLREGGLPADVNHPLQVNLRHIREQAAVSPALLFAWGNLAPKCLDGYVRQITTYAAQDLPSGARIFCLGRTQNGNPMHPLARGKLKLGKDAPLKPWLAQPA